MQRRIVELFCCFLVFLVGAVAPVMAQYPDKPIHMIVGWPPGGGSDVIARMMAKYMADDLKQSIVVENRAGAGGMIGTQAVAHASPDGYTLLFGSDAELTIAPAVRRIAPYDVLKEFEPISLLSEGPFMIVANSDFPPNTLPELLTYAKAHPGKANYGSFGLGTNGHMLGEMLKLRAGIDTVHVAYKGAAPVQTDLMSGQIQYAFLSPMTVVQPIKQGSMKGIVLLAAHRLPGVDFPTSAEAGMPDLIGGTRFGLLAPAGTPKAIVERLHKSVLAVMALPEVKAWFASIYTVPIADTPDEFRQFIASETDKWRTLARKINLELD
jgi:tripartite-type tricarboxylate transporter receptor subunit TctC